MCAMKDAWSGRIVGYSIDSRMKSRLAVNALDNAVAARAAQGMTVTGCIVHADRGSQFRSRKFVAALHRNGLRGSMGRVATCADNAAIESFWALLQKNVLNRRPWATREQLRTAIVTWIERTYHRRRRQARLGRLTPIEYETIMTTQTATAAWDPNCHQIVQQSRLVFVAQLAGSQFCKGDEERHHRLRLEPRDAFVPQQEPGLRVVGSVLQGGREQHRRLVQGPAGLLHDSRAVQVQREVQL